MPGPSRRPRERDPRPRRSVGTKDRGISIFPTPTSGRSRAGGRRPGPAGPPSSIRQRGDAPRGLAGRAVSGSVLLGPALQEPRAQRAVAEEEVRDHGHRREEVPDRHVPPGERARQMGVERLEEPEEEDLEAEKDGEEAEQDPRLALGGEEERGDGDPEEGEDGEVEDGVPDDDVQSGDQELGDRGAPAGPRRRGARACGAAGDGWRRRGGTRPRRPSRRGIRP